MNRNQKKQRTVNDNLDKLDWAQSKSRTMKTIISLICTFFFINCSQVSDKQSQNKDELDIVILGGRVMDPETGLDTIINVGILNGTIHAITNSTIVGKEVINASGLVVAPGFIDTDSYPENGELQIADGVTTVLSLRTGSGDVNNWYAEYSNKVPVNYGVSISYHKIREEVMGEEGNLRNLRVEPAEEQFKKILGRINDEFENGAIALGMGSSGGFDPAGWELIEIFKVAAKHGAPVIATLRDDFWTESNITANLLQMIGAASLSGATIHIPHVGSSAGPHISSFLYVLAKAKEDGLKITAEDYFYCAAEIDIEKGDLYSWTDEQIQQVQPMDSDLRLTRETMGVYGEKDFAAYYHNDDLEPFIVQAVESPFIQVASHASTPEWTSKKIGHPRTAGTYSRILSKYVREESAIPLMEALRKMTLMPSDLISERVPAMRKKGRIQVGADADIVIFNPDKVIDRATFTQLLPSSGFEYVLVNGVAVIKQGNVQKGLSPGKAVRAKTLVQ